MLSGSFFFPSFFFLPEVPWRVAGFADDLGGSDSRFPAGLSAQPGPPSQTQGKGDQGSEARWCFLDEFKLTHGVTHPVLARP